MHYTIQAWFQAGRRIFNMNCEILTIFYTLKKKQQNVLPDNLKLT